MENRSVSDPGRSLLLIGGIGFLGQHLVLAGRTSWKVIVADQSITDNFDGRYRMDITDAEDVRKVFESVRPYAVVNLAAISDIDRCEREQSQARAVNIHGAENVARECARLGARLVFLSSAAVFDGLKHGYSEDDLPHPLSVYGQTKLEAEKAINEILPSVDILRLALVLGLSHGQGTNASLNKWIESWSKGKPITIPTQEYRNPIDASTLARIILFLVEHPALRGLYHVGALDSASRYEIAQQVARILGYSSSLIKPQEKSTADRAPRGRDHFLLTERIREICHIPLGTIDEVVRRSLNELTEG